MKFEKEFTVGLRDIGLTNQLTDYGILSYLEDTAVAHSDTLGYGVKDTKTKHRAWLLMDWLLEIQSRPKFGEMVYVKTWTNKIHKATFHILRYFELYDKNENIIATASSKWVFFDNENNKIVKLEPAFMNLYTTDDSEVDVKGDLLKLREPEIYYDVYQYTIKRADIDLNNHLHNLNYLKLAYEALPEEIYFGEEFNNVRIMYKHEIKLYDIVKCLYSEENGKHIITIKSEDETILHAIIKLY